MSDLEIPGESSSALLKVRATWSTSESFNKSLHAIVDPAVAAELRRMAAAADAQLREAEAAKDRGTAGGPRYPELYARAASLAFHRDELNARAAELETGAS